VDETAFPQDATVNNCFRFPSAFTREKAKSVVDLYFQDSYANLALIEIALYDHGQLRYRNHHKAFVKALIAWGILKVENDDELQDMINGTKEKYSRLPKNGGYLSWAPNFTNEKNTCICIGEELGDTMPYRYKKTK